MIKNIKQMINNVDTNPKEYTIEEFYQNYVSIIRDIALGSEAGGRYFEENGMRMLKMTFCGNRLFAMLSNTGKVNAAIAATQRIIIIKVVFLKFIIHFTLSLTAHSPKERTPP